MTPDHPRSRGVYAPDEDADRQGRGSSPLARGLRRHRCPAVRPGGIIPARAGFTSACSRRCPVRRDHPRSRGVYYGRRLIANPFGGSSPLARGLQGPLPRPLREDGIIPARAGFTCWARGGVWRRPDHPRSRGVYSGATCISIVTHGSSPLARGLHEHHQDHRAPPRIIPARAGFTSSSDRITVGQADHPRSRGVYEGFDLASWIAGGSSPLARGLRGGLLGGVPGRRIIPARAGFTALVSPPAGMREDHPRSRGVYNVVVPVFPARFGSSPLARGLRGGGGRGWADGGIIPARAGFTTSVRARSLTCRDHPRSRGVYLAGCSDGDDSPGSSPLARGLPRTPSRG